MKYLTKIRNLFACRARAGQAQFRQARFGRHHVSANAPLTSLSIQLTSTAEQLLQQTAIDGNQSALGMPDLAIIKQAQETLEALLPELRRIELSAILLAQEPRKSPPEAPPNRNDCPRPQRRRAPTGTYSSRSPSETTAQSVAKRLLEKGLSIDQAAERVQLPLASVRALQASLSSATDEPFSAPEATQLSEANDHTERAIRRPIRVMRVTELLDRANLR